MGNREFIIKLLESNLRVDSRSLLEYRKPIKIEYEVIKTAEGSARVKVGDTEVIVGVKLEIGEPYPDTPNEGGIIVSAELLPLSNPNFELGPPSIDAIELARIIDRGIRESNAIDLTKLCIKEGEKVWNVLIDICPINDGGNLIDVSGLAAVAALKNTVLPAYDGKKINYQEKTNKKLPLLRYPLPVTVFKIANNFIVDPTTEEEEIVDARLTVTTIKEGICALQKGGETPLMFDEIKRMIEIGINKGKELRSLLE